MSMGFCPDFGLRWWSVCPTSGVFPSTWPSVSKGVYPKETIDFMSRQEPELLLFILLGHFSGEVLQSVRDCSIYRARSVCTTFDDFEVIGRGGIRKKRKKKRLILLVGSYSIKFKLCMIFK